MLICPPPQDAITRCYRLGVEQREVEWRRGIEAGGDSLDTIETFAATDAGSGSRWQSRRKLPPGACAAAAPWGFPGSTSVWSGTAPHGGDGRHGGSLEETGGFAEMPSPGRVVAQRLRVSAAKRRKRHKSAEQKMGGRSDGADARSDPRSAVRTSLRYSAGWITTEIAEQRRLDFLHARRLWFWLFAPFFALFEGRTNALTVFGHFARAANSVVCRSAELSGRPWRAPARAHRPAMTRRFYPWRRILSSCYFHADDGSLGAAREGGTTTEHDTKQRKRKRQ